uniref:Beta-mannosidase n=1 Tax=Leersia perrieri TaxID=77586 RepID=A0A0D9WG48_9ORYZ
MAAAAAAAVGKRVLDTGWLAARSTEVSLTGEKLTTTDPPAADPDPTAPWMHAAVPGTVLGTLLKNKLIPDPFYGLNNESIIDIAKSGREHYTFWFFTTFHCAPAGHQHVSLNFRGINYSAEVYLNGHKEVLPKGMFRRHTLDITDVLHPDGKNLLAVLVHPPDHPGAIPPQGGQGGDHEIGKDVATQYVEGWDWICPIRGRICTLENTSSWLSDCTLKIQVSAEIEGNICLVEHLQSYEISVPPDSVLEYTIPPLFFYKPNLWWPNGMGTQSLYNVEISVDVNGFGESDSWSHYFGFRKIESTIDDSTGGRIFKVNGEPVFIRGGNWILSDGLLRLTRKRYMTDIKFHADMNFNMLRCWGGGLAERPDFYHFCDLYGLMVWQEFWITGDVDGRGIPISNPNGPLDHDLFLLCARDTVKLLRNHASLALWVGGNEQVPPIDINKALKNDLKLHPMFESNHTTNGSGKYLSQDPTDPSKYLDGTRVYVQGSMWDGFANGKGDFTDGPYEIQYPESFFKDSFYRYGFNPEVGNVGVPVAATIRATMPSEGWSIPIFKKRIDGYIKEVPNPIWDYHKYIPYSKPGKVHDQIELYGHPSDLDDFCEKAQLVNYVQYRALLEGWTSFMWTKFTGVLIWKTQNPWTGLRGQFYDHLLDQTAGFYGCRCAAEPIHVQLNLDSYFIEVVNTTADELLNVAVEISVWDLDGASPYYRVTEKIAVPPKKVQRVMEMAYPKMKNPKPVYFLLLKLLKLSDNQVLSRNFYWLHLPGKDYKLLEPYRQKQIPLKIDSKISISGSEYKVRMSIENMSKKPEKANYISTMNLADANGSNRTGEEATAHEGHGSGLWRKIRRGLSITRSDNNIRTVEVNGADSGVAFFLHFSVHTSEPSYSQDVYKDTRILPVHYSDNFFSLIPGEKMAIDMSFEAPLGSTPRVILKGWNYHLDHAVTI